MKSNIKKFLVKIVTVGAVFALPLMVSAQNQVSSGLQGSGLRNIFGTGGLTGSQDLGTLIANIIRLMLLFAGAIAVFFIIIGGYQYLTSAGNEEQAEQGKKTLINALIGIVIIVLSYVVVNVVVNLVSRSGTLF
jgi:hypothetical protein